MSDSGGIAYRDASNASIIWNSGTNAWGSSAPLSLSTGVDYSVELESDGTRWRVTAYDANEAVLTQTAWVNWSATLSTPADTYIGWGDPITDVNTGTGTTDAYTEN
jgi:hypothetical protein